MQSQSAIHVPQNRWVALCFYVLRRERQRTLGSPQCPQHGGTADNPFVSRRADTRCRVLAETFEGVTYEICLDDGTASAVGFRRF